MVSIMFIKDSEDGTTAMDEDLKLLARADPAYQESLQSEVEPDPMEGEQTWPTDDELRQAEGEEWAGHDKYDGYMLETLSFLLVKCFVYVRYYSLVCQA